MHSRIPYVVVISAAAVFAAGCYDRPERTKVPTADKRFTPDQGKKSLLDRPEDRRPDLGASAHVTSTAATPTTSGLWEFDAPVMIGSRRTSTTGADVGSLDPRLLDVQTVDVKYKEPFQRGEEFLKNDRFDQALASFDEAKRVDPKNYLAYLGEALCYFRKKDVGSASAAIDFAILYAPKKSELYSYRSQIRAQQGNFHGAIDDMTVALKDHPRDALALSMRAGFHAQTGNHPAAIADYTAALNVRPGELAWLFNRAVERFHAERYKEAVTDATAILAREPKLADVSFLRAVARFKLGEAEAAKADFDDAVRNGLNPRTAEQWRSAFYPPPPVVVPK